MSVEDGYHDEQPEDTPLTDITFTTGEPVDLNKYKPKYSAEQEEEFKRGKEKLEGLKASSYTFEYSSDDMFRMGVEPHTLTPAQQRRKEYAFRVASMEGLENLLSRFGYFSRASVWNGLPSETKIAFMLFYAYRRACMN